MLEDPYEYGQPQHRRMVIFPWMIWAALALAMILSPLLYGCAEKEEDAELRQRCEETGCVVIPHPVWEQIKNGIGV